MSSIRSVRSVGLLGFGAFGRLVAKSLSPIVPVVVHDPALKMSDVADIDVHVGTVAEAGGCDMLIVAAPVSEFVTALREVRPYLRPGATVVDVGSVKVGPIKIMQAELPDFVEIVGTHPLFGPQSARTGIAGRKIVVCPVRGRRVARNLTAVLRHVFKLDVIVTTPEQHDREAALVQGITHLIARVLVRMEPWPTRLTTASFDHLVQATEMVRYDSAGVFSAIEQANPFAAEVREKFFSLAAELRQELEERAVTE